MKRKNYCFNYNEYALDHILKSQYLFNEEKKEKEIFKLLLRGKTCSQIGSMVGYSERTIQNRRKDIYLKTLQFM